MAGLWISYHTLNMQAVHCVVWTAARYIAALQRGDRLIANRGVAFHNDDQRKNHE